MLRQALNLHPAKPIHPTLGELLELRLQLRRMQVEVVHGADSQNAHARKPAAPPIHEVAAY